MKYLFIALSILILFGCKPKEKKKHIPPERARVAIEKDKRKRIKDKIEFGTFRQKGFDFRILPQFEKIETVDSLVYNIEEAVALKDDTIIVEFISTFKSKYNSINFTLTQLTDSTRNYKAK